MKRIFNMEKGKIKLTAFVISEHIVLKDFKANFAGTILAESNTELFYSVEVQGSSEPGYLLIVNYGVAVFCSVPDVEVTKYIEVISNYCVAPLAKRHRDEYFIEATEKKEIVFGFQCMTAPVISVDLIRTAMFDLAQSEALECYQELSQALLKEVKIFAGELARSGKASMGKREMMKFMGRALIIKNRIAENLYIFDVPGMAWEDEYLEKVHNGLLNFFDLRVRFKELEYTLKILDDNLACFRELFLHRESSMLEWIIIILILIEVIDMFITKFMG